MITPRDISDEFRVLLERSGWNPDRCIDITELTRGVTEDGYKCNQYAIDLLELVGRLKVSLPKFGISKYDHVLSFDLTVAVGERDRVDAWEAVIGVALFPVGEVLSGYIVWSGCNGSYYYGHEFGLYFLGDSLRVSMDQLAFPTKEMTLCAD